MNKPTLLAPIDDIHSPEMLALNDLRSFDGFGLSVSIGFVMGRYNFGSIN